jgi:hypothetical protein
VVSVRSGLKCWCIPELAWWLKQAACGLCQLACSRWPDFDPASCDAFCYMVCFRGRPSRPSLRPPGPGGFE